VLERGRQAGSRVPWGNTRTGSIPVGRTYFSSTRTAVTSITKSNILGGSSPGVIASAGVACWIVIHRRDEPGGASSTMS